jgi:MFS family permease
MVVTMVAGSATSVGAGRAIFGVGESALLTAVIAWVVAVADPSDRGRTLGIFGVSVWIGFAMGPVLSENVYQAWGFRATWAVCAVMPLLSLILAAFLPDPAEKGADDDVACGDSPPGGSALPVHRWRTTARAVAAPGTVAAIVWGAQATLMAYLVIHLEEQGMRTDGATGAATVFAVFAGSVIASRLIGGSLPDRIGPARAAQYGVAALAAGLLIIAGASSFAVASLGAVVLGLAFGPLYPSLVMMAVEGQSAAHRAAALGAFNALTSLGGAVGSFVGGVMSLRSGAWSAFVTVAGAQAVALGILVRRGRRSVGAKP